MKEKEKKNISKENYRIKEKRTKNKTKYKWKRKRKSLKVRDYREEKMESTNEERKDL